MEVEMKGKVKPGCILVELIKKEVEKKTKSGIIIPEGGNSKLLADTMEEHPYQVKAIKVAEDVEWIEEGDRLIPTIAFIDRLRAIAEQDKDKPIMGIIEYVIHKGKEYYLIYKNDIIFNYGK
jgi:hypothetical protein